MNLTIDASSDLLMMMKSMEFESRVLIMNMNTLGCQNEDIRSTDMIFDINIGPEYWIVDPTKHLKNSSNSFS